MRWFEKQDLKLSHYSLPLVPILSLVIIISTLIIGFLGFNLLDYARMIFLISALFLISPLFPSIFIFGNTRKFWQVPFYYLASMITYASLAPMMIKTSIVTFFGKKATFIVTPKGMNTKISLWTALRYTLDSLIFGSIIALLTFFSWDSIIPSIILTAGCILSPLIALMSNISTKQTTDAVTSTQ